MLRYLSEVGFDKTADEYVNQTLLFVDQSSTPNSKYSLLLSNPQNNNLSDDSKQAGVALVTMSSSC